MTQACFPKRLTFAIVVAIAAVTLGSPTTAQEKIWTKSGNGGSQHGIGLKLLYNPFSSEGWLGTFRLGITGGLGGFVGDKRWLYPSVNVDLMFFRGGMGSAYPKYRDARRSLEFETIVSYTLTGGWQERFNDLTRIGPKTRSYPLYYFNRWCHPALQNPFDYSVSWGGNAVFFFTKKPVRVQHVGFANLHAWRVQLNYLNDGPPFFPPFGDKFDRYHTGGGFISLHGDSDWMISLVEVGYNKFTGFNHSSYEVSNSLGYAYVMYEAQEENYFNKSNWEINVGNPTAGWGVSVALLNQRPLDVQHKIHLGRHFPLHLVPHKNGFSIGGIWYSSYKEISMKATP